MQPRDVKAILTTGFVAGTLDGASALVHMLVLGREPIVVFNYIASAVFGKEAAYAGGLPMAALGLLFHYLIAYSFTVFYFLIYPRMALLQKNAVISGVAYGIFVWAVMNFIVVPLSRIPPIPFDVARLALALAILIAFIGLPIALLAHRHYAVE